MPIPAFDGTGDLPRGLHAATLAEVVARFGAGTPQREAITARMLRVYAVATATGHLERFIIFGSYVTNKAAPNDVDIVLVMQDTFRVRECEGETQQLFDHQSAQTRFGANVFWIRPSLLLLDTLEDFLNHWQVKRDQGRRGIVEVIP